MSWITNSVEKYIVPVIILFISIYWCFQINEGQRWINSDIISADVEMHYSYLPANLIYQDVSCIYKFDLDEHVQPKIWSETTPEGQHYFKQTIGVPICNLPFFGIAHLIAKNTNYKADGYSDIYAFLLIISALFYGILGLILTSALLKNYFNNWIVASSILLLALATNFTYYVTHDGRYSHVYSFCLIALFALLTHRWYNKKKILIAFFLGLVTGLIILVRPTNGIVVLFFIFYRFTTIEKQILLFKNSIGQLLIVVLATTLTMFIQLIYWKLTTGLWFIETYTYSTFGYFNNPQFANVLFSYRRGWLLYTPIMIFAILELFFTPKSNIKTMKWSIGLTLLLQFYLIASWNSWWFGASFGMRTMVDYYPLLVILLAAFLYNYRKFWFLLLPISIALMGLNIFQEYQHKIGLFHWNGMTKEAYWNVWGETKFPKNYDKFIVNPDEERAKDGKNEYANSISLFQLLSTKTILGNKNLKSSLVLDSINNVSPIYSFSMESRYLNNARNRYAIHIYFNAEEAIDREQYFFWVGFLDQNYKSKFNRKLEPWPSNLSTKEQNDFVCYKDWFEPFNKGDSIVVTGVHNYGKPVIIDSVKLEHFIYEYE